MPELPILTYHRVGDPTLGPEGITISPYEFASQMDLLIQRDYSSLGLEEFIRLFQNERGKVKKKILITFDDGYKEVYANVWPVLRERGLRITTFIATGAIGGTNFWDATKGPLDMLSAEEIKEMNRNGMGFGAHSHTHPRLTELSLVKAREEIHRSKAILESHLGNPVSAFCYPYGQCSPGLKEVLASEGFTYAFASDTGPWDFRKDPFEIRRIGIFPGLTRSGFLRKITGYYHRYRKATGR